MSEPEKPKSVEVPLEAAMPALRKAAMVGIIKARDLRRRVGALLKARDWPGDDDFAWLLCTIVACEILGAGGTVFRRPPNVKHWPGTQLDCPACASAPVDVPACAACNNTRKVFATTWPAWYIVQQMQLEELTQ